MSLDNKNFEALKRLLVDTSTFFESFVNTIEKLPQKTSTLTTFASEECPNHQALKLVQCFLNNLPSISSLMGNGIEKHEEEHANKEALTLEQAQSFVDISAGLNG